jgi:hypothetical protein
MAKRKESITEGRGLTPWQCLDSTDFRLLKGPETILVATLDHCPFHVYLCGVGPGMLRCCYARADFSNPVFVPYRGDIYMSNTRKGEDQLIWNHRGIRNVPDSLLLSSSGFLNGGEIPLRHAGTGTGKGISPPLRWTGVPMQWNRAGHENLNVGREWPLDPMPLIATGISPSISGIRRRRSEYRHHSGQYPRIGNLCLRPHRVFLPQRVPNHRIHQYVFQLFALDIQVVLGTTSNPKHTPGGYSWSCHRGRLDGFFLPNEQNRKTVNIASVLWVELWKLSRHATIDTLVSRRKLTTW